MAGTKKVMDHAAYQNGLKKRTKDMLLYIMLDAQAAVDANPDGENAGYYADEVHYAAAELTRRGGDNTCPSCGNDVNFGDKAKLKEICELVIEVSLYLNSTFESAVPAQQKLRTLAELNLKELN